MLGSRAWGFCGSPSGLPSPFSFNRTNPNQDLSRGRDGIMLRHTHTPWNDSKRE